MREIAIILQTVHALLRDPLRGGRGDFTEIKFDQIRSRCDTFGDFFAKISRFEGFPRFSLSCRRRFSSALSPSEGYTAYIFERYNFAIFS